tara:strand:- start:19244 stop:20416 length:1173 start_codon:yes stop_codon:yes gene_type:complete
LSLYAFRAVALSIGSALAFASAAQALQLEADHNGLSWESGPVSITLGGRLHLDTVSVDADQTVFQGAGTDLRRLRLDATFEFFDDWRFKVDADVGAASPGIKNLWISYRGLDNTTITAGNVVAPFNGENMMSSNNLKLMERSLIAGLSPNFLLGAMANYHTDHWSFSLGAFENPIATDPLTNTDDGTSVVGRVVFAPVNVRRHAIHLAAAVEGRTLTTGEPSKVGTRQEISLIRTKLLNTHQMAGVAGYTNYNLEAMLIEDSWMLRAQYIYRTNDAPALGDPVFNGLTLEAAWVMTGERQRYNVSSGTYGAIHPRNAFGAVELAARYSTLNLSDGLVAGGEETNWTVGVNWYPTRNLRVMGNLVRAETSPGANGLSERVDAAMARFQLSY